MHTLRPALRYYLYGVYTVAALLASVLLVLPNRTSNDLLTILFFAILVAAANGFPIFYNAKSLHTVDGIFLIASIPIISPLGLMVCILSGNIIFAISGKRPWYRTVFNIAQNILSLGALSLFFNVFDIWPGTQLSTANVLAFITIVGVYLVLHGVIIGIVFTLVQNQGLAQFLDNVPLRRNCQRFSKGIVQSDWDLVLARPARLSRPAATPATPIHTADPPGRAARQRCRLRDRVSTGSGNSVPSYLNLPEGACCYVGGGGQGDSVGDCAVGQGCTVALPVHKL